MKKSHSSKQWLRRHVNDPYVQRSKREGYRSRSAYKLTEIDERDRLLKPGMVAVDLGSAPGGWSQVLAQRLGASATVVAIDLLAMEPVPGVTFLQGDFTAAAGLAALEAALAARKADLVLSDMAPNMTGIAVSDQARTMELAELARDFALSHLKRDGALLVKIFQGAGYDEYLKSLRLAFAKVVVRKPERLPRRKRRAVPLGAGPEGALKPADPGKHAIGARGLEYTRRRPNLIYGFWTHLPEFQSIFRGRICQ